MIKQIVIITILLFYLTSLIANQNTHGNFDVFTTNSLHHLGINNEFAELVPSSYDKTDTDDYNLVQGLKQIIGHLPFAEQTILLNSKGTGATLFDFDLYLKEIQKNDATNVITSNFFRENNKAISFYLTESEKRLNKGLGCLKKVANDFGFADQMDEEKLPLISSAINDILASKAQSNFCTVTFLGVLQEIMIKRRAYLFLLTADDVLNPTTTNNDIVYDLNQNICGFKYSNTEESDIVNAFKDYAECQNKHKSLLSQKVMEIEKAITQMSSCIDRDNPNVYAGNSSSVSLSPNITYNSKNEQIGVNNASMIRPDQRTINNYHLDFGYGLGKNAMSSTTNIAFSYPSSFPPSIFGPLNDGTGSNNIFISFNNAIDSYKTPSIKNRPFANLYYTILNTKDIVDSISADDLKVFQNELRKIEKETPPCVSNWVLECSGGNQCKCEADCKDKFSKNLTFKPLDNITPKPGFHISSFSLFVACKESQPPILFTKATDSILGSLFDIFYQGQNLGTQISLKAQACFGVFTSGMKNDKDACRETITEKCGTELDYQCKKSGLYDFLNESPLATSYLPPNCEGSDEECLQWIDKQFILKTLAVKQSGFVSFNLNLQSSLNSKAIINTFDHYCKAQSGATGIFNNQNVLQDLYDDSKSYLYVHKSNLNSLGNTGMEYVETDKEAFNLYISSSLFLKFNLSICLLMLINLI